MEWWMGLLVDSFNDCLVGWLIQWVIDDRLFDRLIDWLIVWFIDWLVRGWRISRFWWTMPPDRGLGDRNLMKNASWDRTWRPKLPKLHPVSAKRKPSKDQVGPRRYKKWQNEAPYGPKTFPRKLVWRPLGRFCVDFGVKMGLELEIVDLAKTLKKQWFFNGFQCLEGV